MRDAPKTVQQLATVVRELEPLPSAAGPSSRLSTLGEPLDRLRRRLEESGRRPTTAVHLSSELDSDQLEALGRWLGCSLHDGGTTEWLQVRTLEPVRSRLVGAPCPSVLILALADESEVDVGEWVGKPALVVVSPVSVDASGDRSIRRVAYGDLESDGFDELLRSDERSSFETLRAQELVAQAQTIVRGFRCACEREQATLAALKRSCEDNLKQAQVQAMGASGDAAELRSLLQRELAGLRKTQCDDFAALIDTRRGTLGAEIEAVIGSLDRLDQEPGNRSFATSIPAGFAQRLEQMLRTRLGDHFDASLRSMEQRVSEVASTITTRLQERGFSQAPLHAARVVPQRIDDLLDQADSGLSSYRGELPRRGLMDYFMAARRYQMVFFMVFSTIGLSFVRSYRELTIPSAVFLLSLGLLNVAHSTRRERAESTARELQRARESLRSAIKSVLSEIQRGWESLLAEHTTDVQERFSSTLETTFASHQERTQSLQVQQQKNLQSRLKALDRRQRALQQGERSLGMSQQRLDALDEQLKTQARLRRSRSGSAGRLLEMKRRRQS